VAQGTIGWPDYPNGSPSTLRYSSRHATDGAWVEPRWDTMWFPHAFKGVMAQLQDALRDGREPQLSGQDNVKTMALVEAGYRSLQEGRSVRLAELGY
jgi:predicted dehydrogenase